MLLKTLTVILIVMFPLGLVIMLTPFGTQYLWTTSMFLFLQALILFILVYNSAGLIKSTVVILALLLLSFIIEYVAVKTSYPFGRYTYTDVLQPVVETVPIAIAFAWFSVTVSSYLISEDLFPGTGLFTVSFISSVIIFATDIMLEPFASFVNGFWLWELGVIPLQNFAGWWILGLLFSLFLSLFIPPSKINLPNSYHRKIPYLILLVNILTFTIINVYYGYILISIFGLLIIGLITIVLPRFNNTKMNSEP